MTWDMASGNDRRCAIAKDPLHREPAHGEGPASLAMQAIVDTGPPVAFFDRSERHHLWAAERIAALDAPLPVREPVLTEAAYRRARFPLLPPRTGGPAGAA